MKMIEWLRRLRSVAKGVGLGFVIVLCAGDALQAAVVTIDPKTTFQIMDGFGAGHFTRRPYLFMGLSSARRDEIYELVFKDLGATLLGIMVYPEFQTTATSPYAWDHPLFVQQREVVKAALSRGIVNTVWVKVSSPPPWMKDNQNVSEGGELLPSLYGAYAGYLSDFVKGMRDRYGIEINSVIPFNEPGFTSPHETTSTSPGEYRDVLKVVGARFVADGLSSRLRGPETASLNSGVTGALSGSYVKTILGDSAAASYLDVLTTHAYADFRGADDWPALKALATTYGKKVWQTESSLLGGANPVKHDIDDGLTVAWAMWRALTLGDVTGWHYFNYAWAYNPKRSSGLVEVRNDGTYSVPKVYYCFKQWSKRIRPGSVRVAASSDEANLQVAAFKKDRELIIVTINRTTHNIPASFRYGPIQGLVEHTRTSGEENYQALPPIPPSGKGFSASIQARSVNTFAVQLEGNP